MNKISKKTIFAGIFGNVLESYDFGVYAFFSPIIATVFFPSSDPLTALLLTFGIFALSFLVRPFGGLVFGYLGDHFGRKNTLLISIMLMSIPTFFLGLLPNYASIGVWAPILLTLLRLVQGVSLSGEMTTAMSYLVEHAPPQRRGFIGSLTLCSSCSGGVFSAALIALISTSLTHEALLHWGWRLPFLLGGIIGFIGLYLRYRFPLHETALYEAAQQQAPKIRPSLFTHYRQLNYKPIISAALLTGIMAMSFYFYMGYFNTFLIKTMGHSTSVVMQINFISQLCLMLLIPCFGLLSDKIGRKPVLTMGIIGLIVLVYPVFYLLQQPAISYVIVGEILFVILVAPIIAMIPTTLAELFHVKTRNTGISLGYNIGQAIFGGTVPLIAVSLTASTHNLYAPAWYLMAGAFLSLFTLFTIKESYQKTLT